MIISSARSFKSGGTGRKTTGVRTKMAERPRTVSIFLKNAAGQVLAQLRDDKPSILFPNCWSTLGGAIEDGETPDEAARRELTEEVEICPPLEFWRLFEHQFQVGETLVNVDIYAYIGEIETEVADIRLHEGQRVEYLSAEAIDRLPFAFGLDQLFRAFFDKQKTANLRVVPATLDDAPLVRQLMREAFAEYEGVL